MFVFLSHVTRRITCSTTRDDDTFALLSNDGKLRNLSDKSRPSSRTRVHRKHSEQKPSSRPRPSPEADARITAALAGWTHVPSRFEGLMAAYHQALETSGPLPVTIADARRSLELITALYESAETGHAVQLPITPAHPKYSSWGPA